MEFMVKNVVNFVDLLWKKIVVNFVDLVVRNVVNFVDLCGEKRGELRGEIVVNTTARL